MPAASGLVFMSNILDPIPKSPLKISCRTWPCTSTSSILACDLVLIPTVSLPASPVGLG